MFWKRWHRAARGQCEAGTELTEHLSDCGLSKTSYDNVSCARFYLRDSRCVMSALKAQSFIRELRLRFATRAFTEIVWCTSNVELLFAHLICFATQRSLTGTFHDQFPLCNSTQMTFQGTSKIFLLHSMFSQLIDIRERPKTLCHYGNWNYQLRSVSIPKS